MSDDSYQDILPAWRKTKTPFHFRIGDVMLVIPPKTIRIVRSTNISSIRTLRQKDSMHTQSGYARTEIHIPLVFGDSIMINGYPVPGPNGMTYYMDGLRALLAQFRRNPILPVDNEFLNDVHGIFNVCLAVINFNTTFDSTDGVLATLVLYKTTVIPYISRPDEDLDIMICYPLFRWYYQQMIASEGISAPSTGILKPGEYDWKEPGITIVWARKLATTLGISVDWIESKKVVVLDGQEFVPWKIEDGKAYVETRKVAEALGFTVDWHHTDKTITFTRAGTFNKGKSSTYLAPVGDKLDGKFKLWILDSAYVEEGDISALESDACMVELDISLELTACTSVSIGMHNIFSDVFVQVYTDPCHQYLGSIETIISMEFETIDREAIREFMDLKQITESYSIMLRHDFVSGFVKVENELVQMAGVEHCLIRNINISTVENDPGLFRIILDMVAFDKDQKDQERVIGFQPFEAGSNLLEQLESVLSDGRDVPKEIIHAMAAESYLSQIELYPDLELPTYNDVEKAIKAIDVQRQAAGLPLLEFKPYIPPALRRTNHSGFRVDPDFYVRYDVLSLGGLINPSAITEPIWGNEDNAKATDYAVQIPVSIPASGSLPPNMVTTSGQSVITTSNITITSDVAHLVGKVTPKAALNYLQLAIKYGNQYGVDPMLVVAVIQQESTGKANIKDGLMQVWGSGYVSAEASIKQGTSMLGSYVKNYNGDIKKILVAYNYGVGALGYMLEKWGTNWYSMSNMIATSEHYKKIYKSSVYGDPEYVPHVLQYYFPDLKPGTIPEPMSQSVIEPESDIDYDGIDNTIVPSSEDEMKPPEWLFLDKPPELVCPYGELLTLPDSMEDEESISEITRMMSHDWLTYSWEGRMVKAFPTFCIVILDEGLWMSGMRTWTNYYTYHSLIDITVVKDRKVPADLAIISLTNIYGHLTRMTRYKPIDKPTFWESVMPRLNEKMIASRANILKRIDIKPGCRIHLRMGHGSVALALPPAFNGVVAEMDTSEAVTLICQGDGIELVDPIAKWGPNQQNTTFTLGKNPYGIFYQILSGREWPFHVKGGVIEDIAEVFSMQWDHLKDQYQSIKEKGLVQTFKDNWSAQQNVKKYHTIFIKKASQAEKDAIARILLFRSWDSGGNKKDVEIVKARNEELIKQGLLKFQDIPEEIVLITKTAGPQPAEYTDIGLPTTSTGPQPAEYTDIGLPEAGGSFMSTPSPVMYHESTTPGIWDVTFGAQNPYGIEHFGRVFKASDVLLFFGKDEERNYEAAGLGKEDGEKFVSTYDVMKNIYGYDPHTVRMDNDSGKETSRFMQFTGFLKYNEEEGEGAVQMYIGGKSPWDIFNVVTATQRERILAVHPYHFRSTLFYGKSYWPIKHGVRIKKDVKPTGILQKDDLEELYKPYSQFWFFNSNQNIVSNGIRASATDICTNAAAVYSVGGVPKVSEVVMADRNIKPELQRTDLFDSTTSQDTFIPNIIPFGERFAELIGHETGRKRAHEMCRSHLKKKFKDMYQGHLVVLSCVPKPYDLFYIGDQYSRMNGVAEIGRVVIRMGFETGFITDIKPDLATAVARYDSEGNYNNPLHWIYTSCMKTGLYIRLILVKWMIYAATIARTRNVARASKLVLSARTMGASLRAMRTGAAIRNTLRGIKGSLVALRATVRPLAGSTIVGLMLFEVLFILVIHSLIKFISNFLGEKKHEIKIYPLWVKGMPFTAGVDGHKTLIPGMADPWYYDKPTEQDPDLDSVTEGKSNQVGNAKGPMTPSLNYRGKTVSIDSSRNENEPSFRGQTPLPNTGSRAIYLRWPVDEARITSPFGKRPPPVKGASTDHKGIDLGGKTGDPIYASASGVVKNEPYSDSYGYYITMTHPGGSQTRYAHLSKFSVPDGTEIDCSGKYQPQIGQMGSTGRTSGPHLHFEVIINKERIDPIKNRYLSVIAQ